MSNFQILVEDIKERMISILSGIIMLIIFLISVFLLAALALFPMFVLLWVL
nr:MAG TPA: hypothetical protein [Crassvirales sp.]